MMMMMMIRVGERERERERERTRFLNFSTPCDSFVLFSLARFYFSPQFFPLFFSFFSWRRKIVFFLYFNSSIKAPTLMASAGEVAAWKQLGGTVRTVKKNKEFIAPGGELF